jgi:tetratricopeptide (TPR) repeat protein
MTVDPYEPPAPPPDPPPARAAWRRTAPLAVVVAGCAALVRVAFQSGIEAYPKLELIRNRLDDQVLYDAWAKAVLHRVPMDWAASGHEFVYWAARAPGVLPQDPLYAYLLAGFYGTVGFAYDGWRALQAVLGVATAVLVFVLARHHVRTPVALVCGVLAGLYQPLVFYEATFLREPLATFLVAVALVSASAAAASEGRRRASGWAAAAGLALGLAVLLRSHLVLLAASLALWLWWTTRQRVGRRLALLLVASVAILVVPVVARNSIHAGRPAWVSSSGPYNLFIGNVHDAAGTGPSAEYARVKAAGPQVDLVRALAADVRAHPRAFVRRQLTKTADLVGAREVPDNLSLQMGRKCSPLLALAVVDDRWLMPLALLGAAVGLAAWRRHTLLYAGLLAYAASVVPFIVVSRLRLPMLPLLAVLAGLALDAAWRLAERRQGWRLAGLVIAAGGLVAAWHPGPARLRPVDYQMAAAAYDRRGQLREAAGDLPAAFRAYARAVALNPDHGDALAGALRVRPAVPPRAVPPRAAELCEEARQAAARERFDAALELLHEAARLAPDWWLPAQYMANVEAMRGRLPEALPHLERAVALAPGQRMLRDNLRAVRRQVGEAG